MAYNLELAARVRQALVTQPEVVEKKMMGGLVFMVNDKMCLCVMQNDLMARLDPALYPEVLQKPGCREKGFNDRPMKSFVFIGPEGTATEDALQYWVDLALAYNPVAKSSRQTSARK